MQERRGCGRERPLFLVGKLPLEHDSARGVGSTTLAATTAPGSLGYDVISNHGRDRRYCPTAPLNRKVVSDLAVAPGVTACPKIRRHEFKRRGRPASQAWLRSTTCGCNSIALLTI